MKLVFYSGGQARTNQRLHEAVSQLVGKKRRKSFTYIPVWADGSEVYFRRIKKRFQRFGFTEFVSLPMDQKISPKEIKKALKSDVIYLAGGNTFYFLKHLRAAGLLPKLRAFAKRGGVLAGLSAGAIIMTPNIGLAAYPPFDADSNDVKLKNWKSLGLVSFEFFPHFEDSARLNKAMIRYARRTKRMIYATEDGGGIVVHGEKIILYGKIKIFSKGHAHV